MKTFKISFFSFLFLAFANLAIAQTSTEKIKVAGECGMCKKKIESAAKSAGAESALWDVDNKILTVTYNSGSTNSAKIQQAVAKTGYDTEQVKATDEAYDKLHSCCKYERSSTAKAHSCCTGDSCSHASCTKDGKCEKDMSCCKKAECSKKDCCKKA